MHDVCWRILTCADVCWLLLINSVLTYADYYWNSCVLWNACGRNHKLVYTHICIYVSCSMCLCVCIQFLQAVRNIPVNRLVLLVLRCMHTTIYVPRPNTADDALCILSHAGMHDITLMWRMHTTIYVSCYCFLCIYTLHPNTAELMHTFAYRHAFYYIYTTIKQTYTLLHHIYYSKIYYTLYAYVLLIHLSRIHYYYKKYDITLQ